MRSVFRRTAGPFRVYAAREDRHPVQPSVAAVLAEERSAGGGPRG